MAIRLVLADDHAVVREGICALLESDPELEVAGQAGEGAEVLDLVERLQPDVVVLDLMMPGMGGLETWCATPSNEVSFRHDPGPSSSPRMGPGSSCRFRNLCGVRRARLPPPVRPVSRSHRKGSLSRH